MSSIHLVTHEGVPMRASITNDARPEIELWQGDYMTASYYAETLAEVASGLLLPGGLTLSHDDIQLILGALT